MATVFDVADAIASVMIEVGLNGRLTVSADNSAVTSWVGSPTGDDVHVAVTVTVLPLALPPADPPHAG